jgi:hypothetical protein
MRNRKEVLTRAQITVIAKQIAAEERQITALPDATKRVLKKALNLSLRGEQLGRAVARRERKSHVHL